MIFTDVSLHAVVHMAAAWRRCLSRRSSLKVILHLQSHFHSLALLQHSYLPETYLSRGHGSRRRRRRVVEMAAEM